MGLEHLAEVHAGDQVFGLGVTRDRRVGLHAYVAPFPVTRREERGDVSMVTRPFPYTQGVPGGATNIILYDSLAGSAQFNAAALSSHEIQRVRVCLFLDQAATFLVKWQAPGGAQRTMNGLATPPAGEAIAANVPFERDVLLLPGRTQISFTTGVGPTVCEVALEGLQDQGLAQ